MPLVKTQVSKTWEKEIPFIEWFKNMRDLRRGDGTGHQQKSFIFNEMFIGGEIVLVKV